MQNPHVCTKACIVALEAAHSTHRLQDTQQEVCCLRGSKERMVFRRVSVGVAPSC